MKTLPFTIHHGSTYKPPGWGSSIRAHLEELGGKKWQSQENHAEARALVASLTWFPSMDIQQSSLWKQLPQCQNVLQGWFQGPPRTWDPFMVSFSYYSYIFRDSYGSGMGIVWETYHKGVPGLGVPEKSFARPKNQLKMPQPNSNKPTSGQFLEKIPKSDSNLPHCLPKTKIAPKQLPKDRLLNPLFPRASRKKLRGCVNHCRSYADDLELHDVARY